VFDGHEVEDLNRANNLIRLGTIDKYIKNYKLAAQSISCK
jgi:hypothetical protein